jgi:endo-1,4-beta-xylanase
MQKPLCIVHVSYLNPTQSMKEKLFKKGILLASSLLLSFGMTQANAGSTTGYNGGYYYGLYTAGSGSASITFPNGGGNWKCVWTSGITDCGSGKGWKPGMIRNVGYNCGTLAGSWHSLALYGWTQSPLIEYYITDKGSNSGTYRASPYIDGSTYKFYIQERVNAPSIEGTKTFWQYKDDRQTDRSLGVNYSITMSSHVNVWKNYGGHGWGSSIYDTVMNIEAFSGPGTGNCTVW